MSKLDLLHLTLTEYEELVKGISSVRELSQNEKKQVTRQRRLIKNRESAQASRQRKKSYIQDLERKVNELVNENAQLKETVSSLASEKNSLEVLLQQAMSDNKNGVNLSHDVFKVLSKKNDEVTLKTPSSPNNNNTVIVLFLLFSFGLLFCQAAHSKNFPVINPDRNSEMVEYKKNQKPEIKVPSRVSGEVVDASSRPEEEIPSLRLKKTNNRVRKHETRSSRGTKRTRDEALPQPNKIQKKTNSPKSTQIDISEVSNIIRPEISNWKPNTTYLLCSNVSQILPPPSATIEDPNAPLMVSLLIPPDCLNGSQGTSRVSDNPGGSSVLEVSCQVVDVTNIPLQKKYHVI